MITINTFSNFGNQPITITIEGTTPAELTLSGLKIDYGQNDVGAYIVNWVGSITFLGKPDLYDEFGVISHKSHKVTIDYGSDRHFVGYLLPQVYNIPNTGFDEYFTLNIESSLSTLSRELFTEETNLYSIRYIFDKITELTGVTVDIMKSFYEPLGILKVYSANFINDDAKNENYMTILEYICTTFGFKALMSWTGILMVTSCEILNGTDPFPLDKHLGIDETYSVSKTIKTVSVTVSNYEMPDIPANFDLKGASKVSDQPKMRIRQGKQYWVSSHGSHHVYWRQLYQFQPGQNAWKFNKYDTSFNPLSDTDIYDKTKYMNGTVPLAGAYPISWATLEHNESGFQGWEQSIWFKTFNGSSYVWNENLRRMITLELDNYLIPSNTFFFTSFEAMWCAGIGNVNDWDRGWNTDYDADVINGYSPNMDEGLVRINPSIPNDLAPGDIVPISMSIKWTELDGTVMYWDANASTPNWSTDAGKEYFLVRYNATSEFEFGSIVSNMPPPLEKDGSYAIIEGVEKKDVWCRFPGTMGKLEIAFGFYGQTGTDATGILFRGLNFEVKRSIRDASDADLSQVDLIYSNLDEFNMVNADYDKSAMFYIYSDNDYSGRGQLFFNTSDNRVDKLQFDSATEKPEHHFIRLATKWESNAKVYTDTIAFDDLKESYKDRFFNGGELDLIEGIANAQLVSCNENIKGEI